MPVDFLEAVENIHGDEDGYLIGTLKMQVGGECVWFHCHFLRVVGGYGEEQRCDGTSECAQQWWSTFCELGDYAFGTFELPGHPGEWVMAVAPYEK